MRRQAAAEAGDTPGPGRAVNIVLSIPAAPSELVDGPGAGAVTTGRDVVGGLDPGGATSRPGWTCRAASALTRRDRSRLDIVQSAHRQPVL